MAEQSASITVSPSIPIRGWMPTGAVRQRLGRFARRKPLGAFGAVVALILIVAAVFAPFIATHDPAETNAALVYAPPGAQLLLGGDQLGQFPVGDCIVGMRGRQDDGAVNTDGARPAPVSTV